MRNRFALGLLAIGLFPATSNAGFVIDTGFSNVLNEQTINFSGHPTGITITGNTNPAPVYNVDAISNDGSTLEGTGSSVGNAAGNNFGLTDITFQIQNPSQFQWDYFDMQLDSLNKIAANSGNEITITLLGGTTTAADTATLPFPYEGNNGENQHFEAYATGSDYFTGIRVQYSVRPTADAIQDLHNLDVGTAGVAQIIPEPSSAALLPVLFGAFGLIGARVRRKKSATSIETASRLAQLGCVES
jgi:hypothetical protein